ADSHAGEAKLDFTPVSRIGREQDPASGANSGALAGVAADRGADLSRMLAATALYQKGDLAGGDALAKAVDDPLQRLALEWIALKSGPRPDDGRLAAFAAAHPDWPARVWIRSFQEAALYRDRARPEVVATYFAADPPRTSSGKLALARALRPGHPDQAAALVRGLWRDSDLDAWTEGAVLGEFAALRTRADHKFRAERLLYAGNIAPALRAAALAGADELALARLWASAVARPVAEAAFDAAPASLKADPGLLYLRIQALRRADRVLEAALLLRHAPREAAALIDGDRWWDERRMVARRLLDAGMARDAYALCAEHSAVSIPSRVDAEFHAGWIALRFLGEAQTAAGHFAATAAIAQTPLAIARAAYWQGRAAEQTQRGDDARLFYERAAAYPIAYYGQLAAQKLHAPALALRTPSGVATGEARAEATRVVALLYAAKLDGFARLLAFDAARTYQDERQLAALAQVVQSQRDGLASVAIGKLATERGFALDESAFPTFGVPGFAPLNNSADLALVYSVARQESEFADRAASGAGAKGLMQILPSTARQTASRAGVAFDAVRLVADPVYNAQLGAAYLGELVNDEGGSTLLALAAYNAGGGRVQQWIDAYGDPRAAGVDAVDWVEHIPFDETRDYVQRVYENLQVYGARFREADKAPVEPQTGRVARADF
ncbi:MAG: lytic transglycosylase domain-containing protein, partial [Roseiarcus sp.]